MPSFRLNPLTRSTRLWIACLGTAMLLPMTTQAHEENPPNAAPQSASITSGHFLNLHALTSDPTQRHAAEAGTASLLQATGLSIHQLVPAPNDSFKDINVLVGQMQSQARHQNPPGEVFVAARRDGSFIALMPDANTIIRGHANGEQSLMRLGDTPSFGPHHVDSVPNEGDETANLIETQSGQRSYLTQRNAQGEIVIDLLAGFTQKAATYIGDHEAYAVAQVASVNRAVENSQIKSVRVRLVGTQVIPNDYPITTPVLADLKNLFAEGMRKYSPDLITAFTVGTHGVDTAAGWAYLNGRYSLNAISASSAFRHELAHNVGGDHCTNGSNNYRFGHNNGRVGSILCGNHVGYFSNPDIKDHLGVPMGDAKTANMARVWRENAAKISAYAPTVVPLDSEDITTLLEERINQAKGTTRYFALDVPAGTQRLAFSVVPGTSTDTHTGQVQLSLKYGAQPTTTSFDYRSTLSQIVGLGANDPKAGRWYLALRTEKNDAQDLILQGNAYGLNQETAQGTYLKLVATSSVDGKNTASVAELLLASAKGVPLPRESWRIHSTSSAASGSTSGSNVINGNPNSYWSSAADARYPHEIVIDMGTNSRFSQLHYLPRQDQGLMGNIKGYKVYSSDSPNGTWNLLADGEFSADNTVKVASLKPVEAGKPPVAVISGKTEASFGDEVVLDASASSDPQGSALSFAWAASPQLNFTYDGPRISFFAPPLARDTSYRFTLTLSNGKQKTQRTHDVLIKGKSTGQCSPDWQANGIYVTDDKVQWKGRQYQARWWIQISEPGNPAFTGPDGSGKVWRDLGPCNAEVEKPVVKPPVASIAGPNQAKPGETVTLDAKGSSDPAGLPLSYRWSVTPTVAFQASGTTLSFVAPQSDKEVSYRFSLAVGNGTHSVNRDHRVQVSAAEASCQGAWNPESAYMENNRVSHKGRFYTARWWSKNHEPGNPNFTGVDGSGKVWRDEGLCN